MRKMWYTLAAAVVFMGLSRVLGTIGMDTVKNLKINAVDMSCVADGIYQGRYLHSRWDYSVSVTTGSQMSKCWTGRGAWRGASAAW